MRRLLPPLGVGALVEGDVPELEPDPGMTIDSTYFPTNGSDAPFPGIAQTIAAALAGDAPCVTSPAGAPLVTAEPCLPQSPAEPSAFASAEPSTLSPSRRRLIALAADIERAEQAVGHARAPAQRYRQLLADEERAEADHARAQLEFDAELRQWIDRRCEGERPTLPMSLVETERSLAESRAAGRVARAGLANADEMVRVAQQHVHALQAERERVFREVVLAEVQRVCDQELVAAHDAARRVEKRCRDLEDHYAVLGDHAMAAEIAAAVGRAKSTVGIPKSDPSLGKAFLARLASDAGARL
jgi:hypothetical protein